MVLQILWGRKCSVLGVPEPRRPLTLLLLLLLLPLVSHYTGSGGGLGIIGVEAAVHEPELNSTFLIPSDFESFHLATWSVDYGSVDPEPLMHPRYEWDEEIGGKGTILVDPIDNLYKAWYISQPGINYTTLNSSEGVYRMITYATSKDGVHWERPLFDIYPFLGQPTNIVLRLPTERECSYANVFVDPEAANKSRTYEMMALLAAEPPGFPKSKKQAIYRYYSPDGIHWTPDEAITSGPCADNTWCSDSMYINKRADGSYLALLKHGPPSGAPPGGVVPWDIAAGGARWIYTSNSSDGRTWSTATLSLSPDWRDGPGFQVISSISSINSKTDSIRRPSPLLIGWLPVFHSLSQTIDMQFVVSDNDGRRWWRPERRSAVPLREMGYYGGGMQWPFRLFVPDRDDDSKVHAYFSGCQGRHADIHSTLAGERFAEARAHFGWTSYGAWGYKNLEIGDMGEKMQPIRGTNWFRGALMRATWDSRRLYALIPVAGGDIPGQVITVTQDASVAGKRLIVNVKLHNQTRTKEMGNIAAELLDAKTRQPIPGYTLDDCVPVGGGNGSSSGIVSETYSLLEKQK